jgi:chromosome partitioning protein
MKTIVILNSKGGVGKSNITRHLAVAAEQENPGAVVLCDTDPQGSLADWWNAREAETPQLAIVPLSEFKAKQPVIAAQFHYLFFDTAAAHAEEYTDVLKAADLIIIPVVPSPDDVRSLSRLTLPVVKQSGRPFTFVMSKARLSTQLLVSTMAALLGSTMLEDEPAGKGAEEMRELWGFVKSRIDEKVVSSNTKKKEVFNG